MKGHAGLLLLGLVCIALGVIDGAVASRVAPIFQSPGKTAAQCETVRKTSRLCSEFAEKGKFAKGKISALKYDPSFVQYLITNIADDECLQSVRMAACTRSISDCGSFERGNLGLCHVVRQNVMDSCRSTDIAKVQDELLSANVIDQECVDGNLDYFLNYPKKDCRQDEYFAQLGQCIETPGSSLAQRKTTFVTLNGRQCLKTKSMLATNSTITLPCDCNLDDLRQLVEPTSPGQCQQIMYVKSNPKCTKLDAFPIYEPEYPCKDGMKASRGTLFISEWSELTDESVGKYHISGIKSSSTCDPLECFKASINGTSKTFDEAKHKNCDRDKSTACNKWVALKGGLRIAANSNSGKSQYRLQMNIADGLRSPMMAIRPKSSGTLYKGDRFAIYTNGKEVYRWIASEDGSELKGVPLPAISLNQGKVVVDFVFLRPESGASKEGSKSTTNSAISIEAIAIFPADSGYQIPIRYELAQTMPISKNMANEHSSLWNAKFSTILIATALAFLLGIMPGVLLVVLYRDQVKEALSSLFTCQTPKQHLRKTALMGSNSFGRIRSYPKL